MGKIENRQRCLKCKYYGRNVCPLMAGADVFQIDKCILDYKAIKSIEDMILSNYYNVVNLKNYSKFLDEAEHEYVDSIKTEKYLNDLITCCWDQNVDCRPSFADIIQMIDMLLSKTK